jgi:hypothetical protein
MLSHDRFRTPPLLRTDSTQWHTPGQPGIRRFLSLADGARAEEVSSKARRKLGRRHGSGASVQLSAQVVERPLRGPGADTIAVAE